jgi:hypothetical protein
VVFSNANDLDVAGAIPVIFCGSVRFEAVAVIQLSPPALR